MVNAGNLHSIPKSRRDEFINVYIYEYRGLRILEINRLNNLNTTRICSIFFIPFAEV